MIPDLALQTAIVSGLRALKRDPRRIEALFGNLPLPIRVQVRDFLEKTPIHFTHGYPFEVPRLPSITLVLRREEEATPLLGRTLDGGPLAEEELLLRDEDIGRLRPPPRDDPSVGDTLLDARAHAFPDESPPLLYREQDRVEVTGRIERLLYDAEVRTQDYFATAFLCRALKAVLYMAELEPWGLHDLRLSGSDLQHTGQEAPHPVFARTLSVAFDYVFALQDLSPTIRSIDGRIRAEREDAEATATLSWQVTIA